MNSVQPNNITTPPLRVRPPPTAAKPARTTTTKFHPPRTTTHKPSTPRFLLQDKSLFNQRIPTPSTATASTSAAVSAAALALDESINNKPARAPSTMVDTHRKRKIVDLTHPDSTSSLAIEPPLAPPPPIKRAKTTTTTAEKKSRASARKKERLEQHERMTAESITWRQKYKKAFPSFVFYFDALDAVTEVRMGREVERLGASVDNFFSKKVTHVVTSRAVPPPGKENLNSPSFPSFQQPNTPGGATSLFPGVGTQVDSNAGPSRTAKRGTGTSTSMGKTGGKTTTSLLEGGKGRLNDALDKNPFIDSKDILSKASEFGLKIWRLEKAELILARITSQSPTKLDHAPPSRNLSLPSLLRDERLFGTRERDPFVARSDTHYFNPKSYYVLIEDSTGEHRPIVTKEFEKPKKGEDPSWPVLWGGQEGRPAFYRCDSGKINYEHLRRLKPRVKEAVEDEAAKENDRLKGMDEEGQQNVGGAGVPVVRIDDGEVVRGAEGEKSLGYSTTAARAVSTGSGAPNLRRALSLSNLQKSQSVFQHPQHSNQTGFLGVAGLETNHKPPSYIAASGNSQTITSNIASGTSTRSGAVTGGGGHGVPDKRIAFLNRNLVPMNVNGNGNASGSGSGLGKSLSNLGGEEALGKLKRSTSVDAGLNTRLPPPREEPKKPGYCENCRIKYEDFKEHILAKKHRRFARNDDNWKELDELLQLIVRPVVEVSSSPASRIFDDNSEGDSLLEGDSGYCEGGYMDEGELDCDGEDEEGEEDY